MLDGEQLELLKLGYKRVFYAELECRCGTIRVGLELEPGSKHPCPVCGRLCPCSFLCVGYSRRVLPLVEIIQPKGKWPLWHEERNVPTQPIIRVRRHRCGRVTVSV
jgi:hypothetical protein